MRPGEILRAVWAGFLATLGMTVLMYALPLVGLPAMDVMKTLGAIFPYDRSPYVLGALTHFAIGIFLAVIYGAFFYFLLPGPRLLRGLLFSLLPWLFAITLLGPTLKVAAEILRRTPVARPPSPSAPVNPCAPAMPMAPATPMAQPPSANPGGVPPQPCAAPAQPCASTDQPCAPSAAEQAPAAQPFAPKTPAPGGIPPQILSLLVHLIYGLVLGLQYRP